ncbi:MAG TPA: hypothetical protein VNN80_29165, partial [Polyangiaceae bacterium]|nr:hypothetical protein [Polyangiaceae bacterium]
MVNRRAKVGVAASCGLAFRSGGALVLLALGLVFNACRSTDETVLLGGERPAARDLGSLYVPLVTPDAVKHRLRNALFEVARSGVVIASLNSEDAPDAEALSTTLNPGQYQVRLGDGWFLERLEEDGSATPVRAALISPNPAGFEVRNGRVTNVAFTFTTSSGTVTFGEGSVNVRLSVSDPASLPSCDIANQ